MRSAANTFFANASLSKNGNKPKSHMVMPHVSQQPSLPHNMSRPIFLSSLSPAVTQCHFVGDEIIALSFDDVLRRPLDTPKPNSAHRQQELLRPLGSAPLPSSSCATAASLEGWKLPEGVSQQPSLEAVRDAMTRPAVVVWCSQLTVFGRIISLRLESLQRRKEGPGRGKGKPHCVSKTVMTISDATGLVDVAVFHPLLDGGEAPSDESPTQQLHVFVGDFVVCFGCVPIPCPTSSSSQSLRDLRSNTTCGVVVDHLEVRFSAACEWRTAATGGESDPIRYFTHPKVRVLSDSNEYIYWMLSAVETALRLRKWQLDHTGVSPAVLRRDAAAIEELPVLQHYNLNDTVAANSATIDPLNNATIVPFGQCLEQQGDGGVVMRGVSDTAPPQLPRAATRPCSGNGVATIHNSLMPFFARCGALQDDPRCLAPPVSSLHTMSQTDLATASRPPVLRPPPWKRLRDDDHQQLLHPSPSCSASSVNSVWNEVASRSIAGAALSPPSNVSLADRWLPLVEPPHRPPSKMNDSVVLQQVAGRTPRVSGTYTSDGGVPIPYPTIRPFPWQHCASAPPNNVRQVHNGNGTDGVDTFDRLGLCKPPPTSCQVVSVECQSQRGAGGLSLPRRPATGLSQAQALNHSQAQVLIHSQAQVLNHSSQGASCFQSSHSFFPGGAAVPSQLPKSQISPTVSLWLIDEVLTTVTRHTPAAHGMSRREILDELQRKHDSVIIGKGVLSVCLDALLERGDIVQEAVSHLIGTDSPLFSAP